jgi:hypothetical protein
MRLRDFARERISQFPAAPLQREIAAVPPPVWAGSASTPLNWGDDAPAAPAPSVFDTTPSAEWSPPAWNGVFTPGYESEGTAAPTPDVQPMRAAPAAAPAAPTASASSTPAPAAQAGATPEGSGAPKTRGEFLNFLWAKGEEYLQQKAEHQDRPVEAQHQIEHASADASVQRQPDLSALRQRRRGKVVDLTPPKTGQPLEDANDTSQDAPDSFFLAESTQTPSDTPAATSTPSVQRSASDAPAASTPTVQRSASDAPAASTPSVQRTASEIPSGGAVPPLQKSGQAVWRTGPRAAPAPVLAPAAVQRAPEPADIAPPPPPSASPSAASLRPMAQISEVVSPQRVAQPPPAFTPSAELAPEPPVFSAAPSPWLNLVPAASAPPAPDAPRPARGSSIVQRMPASSASTPMPTASVQRAPASSSTPDLPQQPVDLMAALRGAPPASTPTASVQRAPASSSAPDLPQQPVDLMAALRGAPPASTPTASVQRAPASSDSAPDLPQQPVDLMTALRGAPPASTPTASVQRAPASSDSAFDDLTRLIDVPPGTRLSIPAPAPAPVQRTPAVPPPPVAAEQVQRAVEIDQIETNVETGQTQSGTQAAGPDIDKLAREVYAILRARLRTEHERRGQR